MAVITVTANTNVDDLSAYRGNDTLVINNGAVVTVNTWQDKFWSGITINNGKLRIENTSTTNVIRFSTGRASGVAAPAITPANGLGSIEISGNWIEIGTGNGLTGQTFTAPYTDHIAALWVETFAGSNEYEIWTNVIARYGYVTKHLYEGLESYGAGKFAVATGTLTRSKALSLSLVAETNRAYI